jgi:hypothetical protein
MGTQPTRTVSGQLQSLAFSVCFLGKGRKNARNRFGSVIRQATVSIRRNPNGRNPFRAGTRRGAEGAVPAKMGARALHLRAALQVHFELWLGQPQGKHLPECRTWGSTADGIARANITMLI